MKNRIDETDAKILKTLLTESCTSFTEIAKDCQISVGAVRMRYKRLWKTGIINGEIMQVNPHSLGYKCISTIGVITAIENERKVREFLKSKLYISRILGTYGKYNIGTIVVLYSIQELSEVIEDLEANPLIKRVDSLIWTEAVSMDHTENLIIKPFTDKNEQKATQRPATINFEETKIDETNRQIAKILSHNSRTPFRQIAETAQETIGKEVKVVRLPGWLTKLAVSTTRLFNRHNGELLAFFAHASTHDAIAPSAGSHTLRDYFADYAHVQR